MRGNLPAEGARLACARIVPSVCPISKGECTGECIYASVMESQRLGVGVFDLVRRNVIFLNRSARDLLARLDQRTDFDNLASVLLRTDDRGGPPPSVQDAEKLQIGSRLLGYTVYRERDYAWVFLKDITEKVRLESIAEAVETMNSIGYVFAAVRHELGNPVNSVKAALSVLRSNVSSMPIEAVKEYLDQITFELGRVENLLRSLKSFSMFEAPQIQPLDVAAFLRSFETLVSDEARRRRVALEVRADDDCWAACDARALQQVLLNVFANAADALEGQEAAQVCIVATVSYGIVTIYVSDNGPGIPHEERRNLFRPFHTTKSNGTGLGLVVSRKMLTKMNGTIAIDSEEGAGTVAVITVPEQTRPA